jgi:hypothetical protein
MNITDNFSDSLGTGFCVKFDADPDPGFGILSTLDPGWEKSDPGLGVHVCFD